MKLQKAINILDQDANTVIEFFKKNEKAIFTNDKLLLSLLNLKWSRKKREKLICLAWIIPDELWDRSNEKKTDYDILSIYRYFAEYMYSGCRFFGDKQIPWEEWKDLAKEQVDILKILVEKNQLKSFRRTKVYRQFGKKYGDRINEFMKKGYLDDWDFAVPSGL